MCFGDFATLTNRIRHFPCFAQTDTDLALFVTGNDEGAKAEAAPAFDDFGRAIDKNHLFGQRGFLAAGGDKFGPAFGRAAASTWTTAKTASTASAFTATFNWFWHYFLLG